MQESQNMKLVCWMLCKKGGKGQEKQIRLQIGEHYVQIDECYL